MECSSLKGVNARSGLTMVFWKFSGFFSWKRGTVPCVNTSQANCVSLNIGNLVEGVQRFAPAASVWIAAGSGNLSFHMKGVIWVVNYGWVFRKWRLPLKNLFPRSYFIGRGRQFLGGSACPESSFLESVSFL